MYSREHEQCARTADVRFLYEIFSSETHGIHFHIFSCVRPAKASHSPFAMPFQTCYEREKQKALLLKKLNDGDPSVFLMKPDKTSKSFAWITDCFSLVFQDNVKQNFVYCKTCKNLITYNSFHGTGSLLRHLCYRQNMTAVSHTSNSSEGGLPSPSDQKKFSKKFDETSASTAASAADYSTASNVHEKSEITKQKKFIEELIAKRDPTIELKSPANIKSEVWSNGNFKIIYQNGFRLDFVMCLICNSVITYRSKTGTASLLRHSCMKRIFAKKAPVLDVEMDESQADASTATELIKEVITIPVSEEEQLEEVTYSVADNYEQDASYNCDEYKEEASKLLQILSYKDMQPNYVSKKGFLDFAQYLINVGAENGKVNVQQILDERNSTSETYFLNILQKMLKPKFEEQKLAVSCDYWNDPNRKCTFFTLYGHYIDDNFDLKKVNLGTLNFNDNDHSNIDYKHSIVSILGNYFNSESELETFLSKTTIVASNEMVESVKSYSPINCTCLTVNRIVQKLISDPGYSSLLPEEDPSWGGWSIVWKHLAHEQQDSPKARELKELLNPFMHALTSLSSEQKPTINEVYIIRKKLVDHLKNVALATEKLRKMLLSLIDELFPIENIHKIAVFLDPRFKSLKFMTADEKTNVIGLVSKMISAEDSSANAIALKEEIALSSRDASSLNSTSLQADNADSTKFLIEYMDDSEEQDGINDEIKTYLDTKYNNIYSSNIIEFWSKRYDLPQLRQLAKDVLCIPAAAVINEKLFSDETKLYARRRLNMEIEDVRRMVYIHDNFDLLSNVL